MSSLQYKNNDLYFGDIKVKTFAKKFGTPLYVYDLNYIKSQIERHKKAFNGAVDIHYAMKANSNSAILKQMKSQKIGIDAVSGGEVLWAIKNGFKPSDIIFSGVGKSHEEIQLALKLNIKMLNVESPAELERIATIAKKMKTLANVGFRFNPDVEVATHPYITTGFRENKFGMDSSFLPQLKRLLDENKKVLKLRGLSLHIGSQIKDLAPLKEALIKTIPVFKAFQSYGLEYFDIGGGLAVNYGDDPSAPKTLEDYGRLAQELLAKMDCRILCEPGRILVAESGILIAKVEYVKTTPHKNFVILNTGMHHLIRPSLYEAHHRILPVKKTEGLEIVCDVVGPICESSDFIAKSRKLAPLNAGDYVAIAESGAYGFTMSSFYNLQKLPKEIVLQNKRATYVPFKIPKELNLY